MLSDDNSYLDNNTFCQGYFAAVVVAATVCHFVVDITDLCQSGFG